MENPFKIYASHFWELGLNVTCITKCLTEYNYYKSNILKSPSHKWMHLEKESQTYEELVSYDWDNATGVGVVLGFENLYAIDLDGCNDERLVMEILQLLGLNFDYEWVMRSGSSNGFHILFYVNPMKDHFLKISLQGSASPWRKSIPQIKQEPRTDNDNYRVTRVSAYLPKSNYKHIFNRIEFRQNDHLVLPPSLHKSTLQYKFLNNSVPREAPSLISNNDSLNDIIYNYVAIEEGEVLPSGATWTVRGSYYCPTYTNAHNLNHREIVRLSENPLYLVVDVETDGLPKDIKVSYKYIDNWPNIIQIAWMLIDVHGNIFKKGSEAIKSNSLKEYNCINIEPLNLSIVGVPLRAALELFIEDAKIAKYVVSHNSDFDLNVIQSNILRCGLNNPIPKLTSICTMKSSTKHCGIMNSWGLKYPTLSELYFKLFEEELTNVHNAETDILATAKCFLKLVELDIIK